MMKVIFKRATTKGKKLTATFFDEDGKRLKTVNFGADGMRDYTLINDPASKFYISERDKREAVKANYLKRHSGMGENYKDPMTAGALAKWILWNKPTIKESIADFKQRFKLN
jgi:hypothetical protein